MFTRRAKWLKMCFGAALAAARRLAAPATVLNDIMTVARAGTSLGIPGLYVTGDPGGIDENAKIGSLNVRLGLGLGEVATRL